MTMMEQVFCVFVSLLLSFVHSTNTKPHIIMVVADDLGWDDVSFHGSNQILTPTLDKLAREGVILNNYYVSPLSTPSRAAFMTGKYASHLGLQHDDFHNLQPSGLPLSETLLPNRLRELGYRAHGVGKWHLGFFAKEYTPTFRGFDSYFGFWSDTEDYYSHVSYDKGYGLDLRRNLELVYNESGTYSTELFTREARNIVNNHDTTKPMFLYLAHQAVHVGNGDDPLQVPEKYEKQFSKIKDHSRRKFAGMVASLDESLKQLTETLAQKGMIDNTIIVFTTDNGGAAGGYDDSAGSNYPLRGGKNTFWEGGVRGVGFVSSPLLRDKGRICEELLHASDWLPTLYAAAGGHVESLGKIDGYNIWNSISKSEPSPRFEILHGVDTFSVLSGALRVGDYKLIVNQDDSYYADWYPRPDVPEPKGRNKRKKRQIIEGTTVDCTIREPHPLLFTHAPVCKPKERPCLFNIKWDPCEYHNIAEIMPNTMKVMLERFYHFANASTSPIYPPLDNSSLPDNHDGSWTFWRDDPRIDATDPNLIYPDPMVYLKMNIHGGSSVPLKAPDNEKIFIDKAKKFENFTRNHNPISKSTSLIPSMPNRTSSGRKQPPTTSPFFKQVSHILGLPIHQHHKSHKLLHPKLTSVEPNVVIEGIGNLIEPKQFPKISTDIPYVPATTERATISPQPSKSPVIDIENVLVSDSGSDLASTILPTSKYVSSTKPPSQTFNADTVGEVISEPSREEPSNNKQTFKVATVGKVITETSHKKTSNKNLTTTLQSNEMKIDLPQVYDVIDETENSPASQAPKTQNIPKVYDVIDINNELTKATSNSPNVGSVGVASTDSTTAQPTSTPLPPTLILPTMPTSSPLSKFFKPKTTVSTNVHRPPHRFVGDIILDGHKFHIEGIETGDNDWLMKDYASSPSNNIFKHKVNSEQSRLTQKSHASLEDSRNKEPSVYPKVTDVIVESQKEKPFEKSSSKSSSAYMDLNNVLASESQPEVTHVTSHLAMKENVTKQNDTHCDKNVQLQSSENAVVVSSVVIVVIASAMVVGVALVAMIAVVARHFQKSRNSNAGEAS